MIKKEKMIFNTIILKAFINLYKSPYIILKEKNQKYLINKFFSFYKYLIKKG